MIIQKLASLFFVKQLFNFKPMCPWHTWRHASCSADYVTFCMGCNWVVFEFDVQLHCDARGAYLQNHEVDFAHFRQVDKDNTVDFTCPNSATSDQCVSRGSVFQFTHEQCGYHGNRWLQPMAPLTLCTCPPPSHQIWSPSVHKHQRSRLPKLSCFFLVKCGPKACFSHFHGNPLGVSRCDYFSCHPWPITYPLTKTSSKSDQNWRKIKDSDIRVLLKRYHKNNYKKCVFSLPPE